MNYYPQYVLNLIGFLIVFFMVGTFSVYASTWEHVRESDEAHFGEETLSRAPYDNEDVLKVFKVRNFRLYEDDTWKYDEANKLEQVDFRRATQKDLQKDEYKIWSIFAGIAGKDFVGKHIQGFVTFRDENTSTLGSVWSYKKARKSDLPWVLSVNANAADFSNEEWRRDITIVMLHEYAHILTLNLQQQKNVNKNTYTCPTKKPSVKTVSGCSFAKAYITGYANAFWDESDKAHAEKVLQASSNKKKNKLVKEYYNSHASDFVTEYAASSLEEDIAESFVDFVLKSKPVNPQTKKDKKILFFHAYPELLIERERKRASIAPTFLK